MKKEKNIFVFGAGAHVPYGLPTGARLREIFRCMFYNNPEDLEIQSRSNELKSAFHKAVEADMNEFRTTYSDYWKTSPFNKQVSFKDIVNNLLKDFVRDFLDAHTDSIDAFLSKQSKWGLVGKLLISLLITIYELKDPLRNSSSQWYNDFFRHFLSSENLMDDIDNFPMIITFNYDRLMTEAIKRRLISYYGQSKQEVSDILQKLDIKHVYGHIGEPCFEDNFFNQRPFFKAVERSKNIKVINEERNIEAIVKDLKLPNTIFDNMYVLGFGFDEINTGIIFDNIKRDNCFVTNVGLHKSAINQYHKSRNNELVLDHSGESVDCSELFRRYI